MERHIDESTASHWQNIAAKLGEITRLAEECRLVLLLKLNITDPDSRALKAIDGIAEAASGQSYLFTPQTEWTGGDSSDPKNFKVRPPHIATPYYT